jgi:peptide/nickel transport system permease protein
MVNYVLRRLLMVIPVIWGIATIVFLLMFAVPGDPARMLIGQRDDPQARAAIEKKFKLDRPIHVQYIHFLGRLAVLDLGRSYVKITKVRDLLLANAMPTVKLAVASILIAVVLGVSAGIVAAYFRGKWIDLAVITTSVLGVSIPVFWLGLMLLLLFSVFLRVLPLPDPASQDLRHLVLPAVTLSVIMVGYIARMTRASLLEVMQQDYVRTARAKGLSKRVAVLKHGLRNAMIPIITIIGINFAGLLGGAIATETVFSWPGIGMLMVRSIESRDLPVVEGGVVILATIFVLVNIIVDVSYAFLDPRIRVK